MRRPRTWIALAFVLAAGLGGECRWSFSSETSDRRRREPLPPPAPILVSPGGAAVALPDGVRIAVSDPGAGTVTIVERVTGLSTGVAARFERPGPLAVHLDGAVLVGHEDGVSRLDPDGGSISSLPFPKRAAIDVDSSGERIAALHADGAIAFVPSPPPGAQRLGRARALAAAPDGAWLIAGEDGGVRALDPEGGVRSFGFFPDATAILAGPPGVFFVLESGTALHRLLPSSGGMDSSRLAAAVTDLAPDPLTGWLLGPAEDGRLLLVDPATGELRRP